MVTCFFASKQQIYGDCSHGSRSKQHSQVPETHRRTCTVSCLSDTERVEGKNSSNSKHNFSFVISIIIIFCLKKRGEIVNKNVLKNLS